MSYLVDIIKYYTSNSSTWAISHASQSNPGKHRLADNLLFSTRPPEVQEKIDQVFEKLVKREVPRWGHNGEWGFYDLLNFEERDVIAQRIEKAWPSNKTLYFIDLGAGLFRWVDAVQSFLQNNYAHSLHQFHVIGTTAEGQTYDTKKVCGNVTTHKISGFKLENLLESFEKLGLPLEDSAQYIVCSWTLQHLVDPLGTLEQAYNLLDRGGLLFGTGWFIHSNPFSQQKYAFGNLLSLAFGIHNYVVRRGFENIDTFALLRDPDYKECSYAKEAFTYYASAPISEVPERVDTFARYYAVLIPHPMHFDSYSCHEMGGRFYGFGTWILEQLIGHEAKRVSYKGRVTNIPLFGYSDKALELYLDSGKYSAALDLYTKEYEVALEKNKGKGPESVIEINKEIAKLKREILFSYA